MDGKLGVGRAVRKRCAVRYGCEEERQEDKMRLDEMMSRD